MASEQTLNTYANELIKRYVDLYTERYGKTPNINRHKIRWGMKDMVSDLGKKRGLEVIEFYFKLNRPPHDISGIIFHYEELNELEEEYRDDEVKRKKLRIETAERVRKWELAKQRATGS